MNCPRCDHEMNQRKEVGVEVDHCGSCGGSWLDHGEIAALIPEVDRLAKADGQPLKGLAASTLHCPKCRKTTLLEKGGLVGAKLFIERCPACLGLWFDGSELAQLKKALTI